MSEQQDDHCLLRFNDTEWRIRFMHGLGYIEVVDKQFERYTSVLDLSKVNWPSYIEAARAGLDGLWWWLDIEDMANEVVACSGGSRGTIYAALRDAHRMGRDGISYEELKRRQAAEREQWAREHPDGDILF